MLTDFGIAKALGTGEDLTSDNIMMGTAKYLSPEQVKGDELDLRADLYSLGLVLYECLAGKVPFVGKNDTETALARLQRDATDLGTLRTDVSPQLSAAIPNLSITSLISGRFLISSSQHSVINSFNPSGQTHLASFDNIKILFPLSLSFE